MGRPVSGFTHYCIRSQGWVGLELGQCSGGDSSVPRVVSTCGLWLTCASMGMAGSLCSGETVDQSTHSWPHQPLSVVRLLTGSSQLPKKYSRRPGQNYKALKT